MVFQLENTKTRQRHCVWKQRAVRRNTFDDTPGTSVQWLSSLVYWPYSQPKRPLILADDTYFPFDVTACGDDARCADGENILLCLASRFGEQSCK